MFWRSHNFYIQQTGCILQNIHNATEQAKPAFFGSLTDFFSPEWTFFWQTDIPQSKAGQVASRLNVRQNCKNPHHLAPEVSRSVAISMSTGYTSSPNPYPENLTTSSLIPIVQQIGLITTHNRITSTSDLPEQSLWSNNYTSLQELCTINTWPNCHNTEEYTSLPR